MRGGARRRPDGQPTTTTRSWRRPWPRGCAPWPRSPGAATRREERDFQAPRPYAPAPKTCRRTRTPRQAGRPARAASTRTTRTRGPASLTPAKGSRLGKCPRELAAPASRQRPAGRRVREVRRPGPRTLSRPPDGQSGRQNDTYERPATPRGQCAADGRGSGGGSVPILQDQVDRSRLFLAISASNHSRFPRFEALRAPEGPGGRSARHGGAARHRLCPARAARE